MVEALLSKARTWEVDRRTEFLYDGVSIFLLMLKSIDLNDGECYKDNLSFSIILIVSLVASNFKWLSDSHVLCFSGTPYFYAGTVQHLKTRERARSSKTEGKIKNLAGYLVYQTH